LLVRFASSFCSCRIGSPLHYPIFYGALVNGIHRQCSWWYVVTDYCTSCSICTVAYCYRSREDGIGTGAYFGANNRTMLVYSIIVSGDIAATDIGIFTNFGIPSISQVRKFCSAANLDVFGFIKRPDLTCFSYNRARPQIGERTDCRSRPDLSLSGFSASKVGVLSNHNVVECCIWADRGTGSDRCSTLQLGIWFTSHVLRQLNVYINPGSCRINDSNALAHPALGYATVQFGPERCELYPVVDTLNFHEIIGHICRDTAAFSSS